MSLRTLLRILLIAAIVPLVLRTRDQGDAAARGAHRNGADGHDDEEPWEEASAEDEDAMTLDDDLVVDINAAPRAALLALPGIDDGQADLILEHRPFRSKHDLLRLGYVADDVYRQIRDHIVARQAMGADRH
jgi:DNA uptake protein ComE-like DNA-binding protein